MKSMTLLKALNNIDDKYIEEAAPNGEVETTDSRSLKKINIVRYVTGFAAIAAAAVAFITVSIQKNNIMLQNDESVMVVNPYVYYDTLEEAEKAAGFEITAPENIDNEEVSSIIVISEDIMEINYGTDSDSVMTIRKAKGSEDISGDYTVYGFEKTLSYDGINVIVKGDDDLIKLLTWQKNDFTYALRLPNGMTEENVWEIIHSIE